MDFPTASTFVIEGMLPGQTVLSFDPKASDLVVQSILYKGQDVRWAGFDTGSRPADPGCHHRDRPAGSAATRSGPMPSITQAPPEPSGVLRRCLSFAGAAANR